MEKLLQLVAIMVKAKNILENRKLFGCVRGGGGHIVDQ